MHYSFTHFKKSIFFLLGIMMHHLITAQQNGGFENWSPSGSPPPFDWKYPTGWTTTNAATEFITAGVTRNTFHHSGEFAAQIKTLNIFGTLTRSQLALGNCDLDSPHYQVKAYTGGEPLLMVPDQVSFYYQLTAGVPSEHAVADILIKRPTGSSFPDTVYYQSVILPAVGIYTEVNVPIPDTGIDITTDSIVILFSSNDTNEMALNTLYVDDVSIDFVSSDHPAATAEENMIFYPNPVRSGEEMTINLPIEKLHHFEILDRAGISLNCCMNVSSDGSGTILGPVDLPAGLYWFVVDGRYGRPFVVTD
jgi:hypothetical protein